jgi:hypothetical protein
MGLEEMLSRKDLMMKVGFWLPPFDDDFETVQNRFKGFQLKFSNVRSVINTLKAENSQVMIDSGISRFESLEKRLPRAHRCEEVCLDPIAAEKPKTAGTSPARKVIPLDPISFENSIVISEFNNNETKNGSSKPAAGPSKLRKKRPVVTQPVVVSSPDPFDKLIESAGKKDCVGKPKKTR